MRLTGTVHGEALAGNITAEGQIVGRLVPQPSLKGVVSSYKPNPYTGSYTVTPGDSAVVINCSDLLMTGNITVNPVPSNYGHIGWNGQTLTVS